MVLFTMKEIWFEVQGCHLLIGDLDVLLVKIAIKAWFKDGLRLELG